MHQFEKVPGSLAFFPQPVLAAAEEHDTAARQRREQRFAVHVAEHQHRAAAGVLHHGRDESIALGEVHFVEIEEGDWSPGGIHIASGQHNLTGTPAARSCSLSLGMRTVPE